MAMLLLLPLLDPDAVGQDPVGDTAAGDRCLYDGVLVRVDPDAYWAPDVNRVTSGQWRAVGTTLS